MIRVNAVAAQAVPGGIETKQVPCRCCGQKMTISGRYDAEGYRVTSGWEGMRDHWELTHPKEMEALQAALDG